MPPGLGANPLDQKLAIGQRPRVGDLCSNLGLAGVEAEQGGDRRDHVLQGKVGAPGHDVGRVKLDRSQGDATLVLADARLDEGAQEGGDDAAGGTPRGGPECEEGDARGGGEGEVSGEGVWVADAGRVAVSPFLMTLLQVLN